MCWQSPIDEVPEEELLPTPSARCPGKEGLNSDPEVWGWANQAE